MMRAVDEATFSPDSFRMQKSTPTLFPGSQLPTSVRGVPPSVHPNVFGDCCSPRVPNANICFIASSQIGFLGNT